MLVWGTDVLVTNSNDDTVSVIDTTTNTVVQTIATNPPRRPLRRSPSEARPPGYNAPRGHPRT
jgi:YVTN family beta-propeller protein